MEDKDRQQRLDAALANADWTRGLTKPAVANHVAAHPDLHAAITRSLPDGTYFSAADVRNVLPDEVWHDLPPATAAGTSGWTMESEAESAPAYHQPGGTTDRLRQVVGSGTQAVSQRTTAVAARTRERAGSVTQAARGASATLPERARQTASQTRDQVVNIRTRRDTPADPPPSSPASVPAPDQETTAGRPSAVASIGRTYNGQPGTGVMLAVAGVTLGIVSGLFTLLAKHLVKKKRAQRHADRLKLALAGFWLMTFALNAWSAWRAAASPEPALDASGGAGASTPTTWNDLDPTRDPAAPATSATSATDEYPTVGPV